MTNPFHCLLALLRPRVPLSPVNDRIRRKKREVQNELAQLAADRQASAQSKVRGKRRGGTDA